MSDMCDHVTVSAAGLDRVTPGTACTPIQGTKDDARGVDIMMLGAEEDPAPPPRVVSARETER
jgi:hypothetical protein